MRLWDEVLMMGKKPVSVVTDGLVFWIDGQDSVITSGSSKYLKDRISNNNFPAKKGSSNTYWEIRSENNMIMTQQYNLTPYHIGSGLELSGIKTIEYSIAPGTYSSSSYASVTSNLIAVGYIDSRKSGVYCSYVDLNFQSCTAKDALITPNAKKHIVATELNGYPCIYVNGVLNAVGSTEFESLNITSAAVVATLYKTYGEIGIGAIRFYDKALEQNEILQNYKYEKSLGRAD